MRRLAQTWPVLFVNSLGVRMPSASERLKFLATHRPQAEKPARGLVHVENQFWVCSPLTYLVSDGIKLSSWALAPQIRIAAAMAGISGRCSGCIARRVPPCSTNLDAVGVVLQRTDRFEAFPEAEGPTG